MASRRAPLHPLLRLIYFLLRIIATAGVYVFYRRRIVLGKKNLDFDGPAIIVANHPSTLMDVLNVCIHIRQESFFLANYGLFKNPLSNWLLTRLYCIPVKRREDVAAGESRNNDAAFEQSYRHMEKRGLLFIAAEGVSWMDRTVRPFKTGAARIAFGTEARNNWQSGVKILPVGLSYSAPNLFRSEVIVQYGEPVYARDWQPLFETEPEKAIDDFTQAVEQKVRSMVLDTHTVQQQQFIEQLEAMIRPEFPANRQLYFGFRKNLIEQNIDNQSLIAQTAAYFEMLEKNAATEEGLAGFSGSRHQFMQLLMIIAVFPIFVAGYAFWWLPCYLPALLAKKLKLYAGYDSNVKLLAGLFTFPLALWGAFRLARFTGLNDLFAWGVLLALLLLACFLEQFLDVWYKWRKVQQVKSIPAAITQKLLDQRAAILARIIR